MTKLTHIKTVEQGRAAFAHEKVKEAKSKLQKPAEYKSYVRKFPSLVKTNGLAAALAFAYAKKKSNGWALISEQIGQWLAQDEKQLVKINPGRSLVEEVIAIESSATYRAVTNEVLALFTWLRRFAEGMIEGEADSAE